MNFDDEELRRLTRELAALTGESMTAAVTTALLCSSYGDSPLKQLR